MSDAKDGDANEWLMRAEQAILHWHGISVPSEAARRLAADLAATIRGFEALRGQARFEDEPSSFEAALIECKE